MNTTMTITAIITTMTEPVRHAPWLAGRPTQLEFWTGRPSGCRPTPASSARYCLVCWNNIISFRFFQDVHLIFSDLRRALGGWWVEADFWLLNIFKNLSRAVCSLSPLPQALEKWQLCPFWFEICQKSVHILPKWCQKLAKMSQYQQLIVSHQQCNYAK